VAPLTLRVVEAPTHIEAEAAVSVGDGDIVTFKVVVLLHPPADVATNV
jgi:hypothetical protein